MLLLFRKHTDTLIQQTKTKPQETLEFVMHKQMQIFSFNPPINLPEEGKWFLAVTSFEATDSVFNITDENNSFSITIPGHWDSKSAQNTIDELNKLLELRTQKAFETHVKEVRKRGKLKLSQLKIGDNEYKLSDFDTQKNEILEELKLVKNNEFEDLVYRFQLTYDQVIDNLDLKFIPTKRTGSS